VQLGWRCVVKQLATLVVVAAVSGLSVAVAIRRAPPEPLSRLLPQPPPAEVSAEARRMSVANLQPLQTDGRALVVDVRIEASFAAGHIAGAINVPVGDIEARGVELIRLAAGRPIVTYCSCVHEHTSAVAALELAAAGARDVSALLGGYPAWVAHGGPVER
jgi:rhodanese-related sulfurtransferase